MINHFPPPIILSPGSKQEKIEQIRKDIRDFKSKKNLDKVRQICNRDIESITKVGYDVGVVNRLRVIH